MPLPDIDPLGLTALDDATTDLWGGPVGDRLDKNSARSADHEARIVVLEGLELVVGISPPDPSVHPLWVDAN